MAYVVYGRQRMRDGLEEWARVYSDKDAALKCLNEASNGFWGRISEVRLFELGREIPLIQEAFEQPRPAKTSVRFRVEEE